MEGIINVVYINKKLTYSMNDFLLLQLSHVFHKRFNYNT